MKVLSLFSGVGGFDLGLENAGMETVFQCEWDKHATKILERHWPDVPRWGDITTLTGRHILDHAPVIDVVAWGSPCQDLSVAGKRAGLSGERSGLFHEGIRIIKELRKETNNAYPRISIWENVYGALNSNKGADFGLVLDEMAEAGAMVIEWRVLDAQYFGVPQRRRRVFVIAIFDPRIAANCPDPLLPLRQGVRWNPATSRTTRQTTTRETEQSLASGRGIANTIPAELYHKSTVVNQDVNNGHLIVGQNNARPIGQPVLGSDIVGPLAASDWKFPQQQQVNENKVVIEPFVKAKRAQSASDDETWVEGDINPTINQFNQGDVRATTAIVTPSHPIANTLRVGSGVGERGDGTDNLVTAIVMRQREGKPGGGKGPLLSEDKSLTLAAAGNDQTLFVEPVIQYDGYNQRAYQDDVALTVRIGRDSSDCIAQPTEPTVFQPGTMTRLGGGVWEGVVPTLRAEVKRGDNEPHIAIHSFDTQFGSNANVFNNQTPPLKASQASPSVVEPTMSVRRLTPLECERLMGWPDDWTAGQADTHRYKQCGNGVASPVAQWIGEQILNIPQ